MTEIRQSTDGLLPPDPGSDAEELVRVENLVKYFPVRGSGLISRTVAHVQAVDGVSLSIPRGQTVGLVGETGCGKSTLARCIAGLIPVTAGKVYFEGRDITNLPRRAMQPYRREIQMIFQDPYGSLNPRRRVGSTIVSCRKVRAAIPSTGRTPIMIADILPIDKAVDLLTKLIKDSGNIPKQATRR